MKTINLLKKLNAKQIGITIIIFTLFYFGTSYHANAQIGNRLGNKIKESATKKTEKAIEKKVDEKIDEAIEDIFEGISNSDTTTSNQPGNTTAAEVPSKPQACAVEIKTVSASSKSVSSVAKSKRYPFEKGTIYQQVSAMGIQTTPVTHFDKFGEWSAEDNIMEMKVLFKTVKSHTRKIIKANDHWELNMDEKTGRHYNNEIIYNLLGMNIDELTEEFMKEMKIEKLGEVDYLGYRCDKYKITNDEMGMIITTIVHGNLTMWAEGTTMGISTSICVTKIELQAPPKDVFEIPKGFTIIDEQ